MNKHRHTQTNTVTHKQTQTRARGRMNTRTPHKHALKKLPLHFGTIQSTCRKLENSEQSSSPLQREAPAAKCYNFKAQEVAVALTA